MEIKNIPNGQVNETKKSNSDLETFKAGDQIYYEGSCIKQPQMFLQCLTKLVAHQHH